MQTELVFPFSGYPVVRFCPDDTNKEEGKFVEVHFYSMDYDTGKIKLSPFFVFTFQYRNPTPDEVTAWAYCMLEASSFAKRESPIEYYNEKVFNEVWYWLDVEGIK